MEVLQADRYSTLALVPDKLDPDSEALSQSGLERIDENRSVWWLPPWDVR